MFAQGFLLGCAMAPGSAPIASLLLQRCAWCCLLWLHARLRASLLQVDNDAGKGLHACAMPRATSPPPFPTPCSRIVNIAARKSCGPKHGDSALVDALEDGDEQRLWQWELRDQKVGLHGTWLPLRLLD
jgi:hypothetical protein